MKPSGQFDLANQNQFFGGWPTLRADPSTVVLTFPVEGWKDSATVTFRQRTDGTLEITAYGTKDPELAKQQALAALSLDEDGSGWAAIGKQDPVIGDLQQQYHMLRPSLFHSPYEAAAHFIIGHRISMVQGRKIRARMAEELGEEVLVNGESFHAFPLPQKLLQIESFPGLNETKISRLHAMAQAALDGWLTRDYLRSLPDQKALVKIETLPGVGPFFSQGILYRGAGSTDGFTYDDMTHHAIQTAYHLDKDASQEAIITIAEAWRPYRMWATVLLHVWIRQTGNLPVKRNFSRKRPSAN